MAPTPCSNPWKVKYRYVRLDLLNPLLTWSTPSFLYLPSQLNCDPSVPDLTLPRFVLIGFPPSGELFPPILHEQIVPTPRDSGRPLPPHKLCLLPYCDIIQIVVQRFPLKRSPPTQIHSLCPSSFPRSASSVWNGSVGLLVSCLSTAREFREAWTLSFWASAVTPAPERRVPPREQYLQQTGWHINEVVFLAEIIILTMTIKFHSWGSITLRTLQLFLSWLSM